MVQLKLGTGGGGGGGGPWTRDPYFEGTNERTNERSGSGCPVS